MWWLLYFSSSQPDGFSVALSNSQSQRQRSLPTSHVVKDPYRTHPVVYHVSKHQYLWLYFSDSGFPNWMSRLNQSMVRHPLHMEQRNVLVHTKKHVPGQYDMEESL